MSRYWVGGATGFLGSHLVEHLLAEGHEVIASSARGGQVAGVHVAAVDITSESAVSQSAAGCDGAFVCVGKVSRKPGDAEQLHHLHVDGTRACLRGLRAASVPRVVFTSTSGTVAVGESPDRWHSEEGAAPIHLIGRWPYYRTKLYGEQEALAQHEPGSFEVVVVNPSQLLGPGDLRSSSTGDIRRFLERQLPAVPSGGLAFVDVRDVAQTMLVALFQGRGGERYLLNAVNIRMAEFMARLERLSGVAAPRLRLPAGRASGAMSHGAMRWALHWIGREPDVSAEEVEMAQCFWYCNSAKAEKELGFSPRDGLETLTDTIADLIERGVAFPKLSTQ